MASVAVTAPASAFPLRSPRLARTQMCCSRCGAKLADESEPLFKKGAITLTQNPIEVRWFGKLIPLSPVEAHLFAVVALKGKASFEYIDAALEEFGAKRQTRSIVMLRTRRKFTAIGASDPFELIRHYGLRLRVDPDENLSTSTWIGLRTD